MGLEYDIVIIGSGAAGLTAAAVAATEGLNTLLVEEQSTLGGTTMLSGGTVWVPNNSIAKEQGIRDSEDDAMAYIEAAVSLDQSDHTRKAAKNRLEYLKEAPKMIDYLRERQFKWTLSKYPDYQPRLKGAMPAGGRTLNPGIFDAGLLGSSKDYLNIPSSGSGIPNFESFRDATRLCKIIQLHETDGDKADFSSSSETLPVSMGCSLIAQLLYICNSSNRVTIMTETAFSDLLLINNKVTEVELEKINGEKVRIQSRAVFLAVAGFARNESMRAKYQQKPASPDWTLTQRNGDKGYTLQLMMSKGADISLLQETWGIPTMHDPLDGSLFPAPFVLSKPHCVLVNQHDGRRFCSEARPYGDYKKDAHASVPSWLILDRMYLSKYTLGSLNADVEGSVEMAVQRGHLKRSSSLWGLADQLEIERADLTMAIDEWNEMCENGKDIKFGKGEDEYQRFMGDESMKPNPNMGTVIVPPFYAAQVFPGDAGSKGGLLTDEKGRVLHKNGSIINGLYAAGNVAASPFGKPSIGAGITIGPAMTFAYVGVMHLCEELRKLSNEKLIQ